MPESGININFLNSYRADTSVIPEVIDILIQHLRKVSYPQDEIDEIILSMDEAITNAVQETISKQENIPFPSTDAREITVSYSINADEFGATIIDHGKGLDIKKMLQKIPDSCSENYHEQIINYVTSSESKKLQVRLNGKEILLNGMGAGLKIILAFMDSVTIDLIDRATVLSSEVSCFTEGTILNLKRKRRYR